MQGAGQECFDLDWLDVELVGQGANVVAMAGQRRLQIIDLAAEHAVSAISLGTGLRPRR